MVEDLLEFLRASPTPFHAVNNLKARLEKHGYSEIFEADSWKLAPGARHFVIRDGSVIVAFQVGQRPPAEAGFRLVGAHTDSPCLRLKPLPDLADRHYLRLGVEIYGGVLLSTWFDRDLSLAGRVFYRTPKKQLEQTLIDFHRPIAVIPNLAIHLNRSANENRTIQRQVEVVPLAGHSKRSFSEVLRQELGNQGKQAAEILGHDLSFYDTQAPAHFGLEKEFIASSRLDNLLSCWVATNALCQSRGKANCVLVCNDHEEVGSASSAGAEGPFLRLILERLCGGVEAYARAASRSMLVSTDNAHGVHPSYPEKHDGNHGPILNQGPALKTNANQRYATNAETAALLMDCCHRAGVPLQHFVSRNDVPCGSTIGPLTATVTGIKTADLGVPTFAMHSIREVAGSEDAGHLLKALTAFYDHSETP